MARPPSSTLERSYCRRAGSSSKARKAKWDSFTSRFRSSWPGSASPTSRTICFPVFRDRAETPEWHNTLSILFAGLTQDRAKRLAARLVDAFDRQDAASRTGLQLVAADCLDILLPRGVRLKEETERACREVFLTTMVSEAPASVRCRVGSTLGRLGDQRFHGDDLFCLRDEPMLGFVEVPAGAFVVGSEKDDEGSFDDDRGTESRSHVFYSAVPGHPSSVQRVRAWVGLQARRS